MTTARGKAPPPVGPRDREMELTLETGEDDCRRAADRGCGLQQRDTAWPPGKGGGR